METLSKYVIQFQKEDFKLFDRFYKETSQQVFFTIKKYIKDNMTIEDIMQDVYVKFLKKIQHVDPSQNIKSYLTTIARNASIDYLRQHHPVEYDDNHVYEAFDDQRIEKDYLWLLETLPSKEKEIVYLHVIEELKFKDIAIITDAPLGTILWRYKKAMTQLKEELKKYET
jgi:RNA polymerase sigma-70 factor (ECF subfamily)